MLGHLFKFDFCHCHQRTDLVFGALEVLDAERVDSNDLDASFVADFENLVTKLVGCTRVIR